MRRLLLLALCSSLFFLSACLGGTGAPGTGAPASSSFADRSSGADTSNFLSASSGAAADKPPGPVTSNGDSELLCEGRKCRSGETPTPPDRLRYGADLSQVIDKTKPPATLDLSPNGRMDLSFVYEMPQLNLDGSIEWISERPVAEIRWIIEPEAAPGIHLMCGTSVEPVDTAKTTMPGSGIHQLALSSTGKLSPYLSNTPLNGQVWIQGQSMADDHWLDVGNPDCKDGFVPMNDEQYNYFIKQGPLGSFNVINSTSTEIQNSRIRAPF